MGSVFLSPNTGWLVVDEASLFDQDEGLSILSWYTTLSYNSIGN